MLNNIIKSKLLEKFETIITAISPRIPESDYDPFNFNLSFNVDSDKRRVELNRKKFFSSLGITYPEEVALLNQTHSDIIKIVDYAGHQGVGDAMITLRTRIALTISIADCTPILVYDAKNKIIAAVHSGWRGTYKKILPKTLRTLKSEFGTQSHSLFVFIGPSICPEHYEVKEDVASKFPEKYLKKFNGKIYLNVSGINYSYLLNDGIPPENIEYSNVCTYESPYLHSFRRDKENSGRSFAIIMINGIGK